VTALFFNISTILTTFPQMFVVKLLALVRWPSRQWMPSSSALRTGDLARSEEIGEGTSVQHRHTLVALLSRSLALLYSYQIFADKDGEFKQRYIVMERAFSLYTRGLRDSSGDVTGDCSPRRCSRNRHLWTVICRRPPP
jgi:hypothetical protein